MISQVVLDIEENCPGSMFRVWWFQNTLKRKVSDGEKQGQGKGPGKVFEPIQTVRGSSWRQ